MNTNTMLFNGTHSAHPVRAQQVDDLWHCALTLTRSCTSMVAHCDNLRSGGAVRISTFTVSRCLLASSYRMFHAKAMHHRERRIYRELLLASLQEV